MPWKALAAVCAALADLVAAPRIPCDRVEHRPKRAYPVAPYPAISKRRKDENRGEEDYAGDEEDEDAPEYPPRMQEIASGEREIQRKENYVHVSLGLAARQARTHAANALPRAEDEPHKRLRKPEGADVAAEHAPKEESHGNPRDPSRPNYCKPLHFAASSLRPSIHASILAISPGMSIDCGQCETHRPQPVQ